MAATLSWIRQLAPINSSAADNSITTATDTTGNVYIAYASAATRSGGVLLGSTDIVVAKLNSSGVVQWVRQNNSMNTVSAETVPQIVVDSAYSRVYVTYATAGTVSGGTFIGLTDVILLALDLNGNTQWVRATNAFNTTNTDTSPSVAIDSAGFAYVTYHTGGTASSGESNLGNFDIAVFKINSSGTMQWTRQFRAVNTTGADTVPSIACDPNNNVYVAYQTAGTVSGGTQLGNSDIAVFKLTTAGVLLWVRQSIAFNTIWLDSVPKITIDRGSNLYIVYQTAGTISGSTVTGSPIVDTAVLKMDSNGLILWTRQLTLLNSSSNEETPSVAIDLFGNVYMAYRTLGTLSGGTQRGNGDIAVAKLNNQGAVLFLNQLAQLNTSSSETLPSIAVDTANNSIFVSYTSAGAASGGTALGGDDVVVARFTQASVTTSVPAAPTGVTATQITTLSATVSWVPPTNSNNSVIRSYVVTASPGGLSATVDGSLTSATVTGLNGGGTSYTFTVRAVNLNGNGALSTATSPLLVYRGPDAPTAVSGVSLNGAVVVSWAPPAIVGDSAITGYTVTSMPGLFTASAGAGATSATVSGLANGTSYTFTVTASNSYATGPSSTASAAVVPSTVPDMTTGVQARPGDIYGAVLVNWIPPAWNGGSAITNYTVVCTSDPAVPTKTVGSTATYINFPNLTIGTPYTFTVYAANIKGLSLIPSIQSNPAVPSTDLFYTEWIRQHAALNAGASEQFPSIVTDAQGNSYIAYISNSTISGSTFIGGSNDIYVTKLDAQGNVQWIRNTNAISTIANDAYPQVALDAQSNLYITYVVGAPVSGGTHMGGWDVVLTKLDTFGNVQWSRQNPFLNSTGDEQFVFIATDPAGNSYIAYQVSGAVSGGTFLGGSRDIAVAKFNTNGTLVWLKQQAAWNTTGTENIGGIAIDSAANVYVTYTTSGTVSGGALRGGNDVVVIKLNTNGDLQWIRQDPILNTTSSEYGPSLTIDFNGDICLSYATQGTVSGGIFAGSTDVAVAKMNSITGALIWAKQYRDMNSTGNDERVRLVCDSTNNIYIAYRTGGTISGGVFAGSSDIAVAKLDTNGALLWIKAPTMAQTVGTDDFPTIGIDAYGNLYVAWYGTGAASGGIYLGGSDIIVMKLSQFTLGAPSAPQSAIVSPKSLKATVSWAPLAVNYVYPITYTLTANPGNFSTTVGSTGTSATITGLSGGGQVYTFELTATNSQGTSSAVTLSSPIYALSSPPTSVVANTGNMQATISWIPPSAGELPITNYTVTASPGGRSVTTINATTYRAIISGLTNGIIYTFTVVANTSGGSSDPSLPSNAITPSTVPDAPFDVISRPGDLYGAIVVSWQQPLTGGSPITLYRVTMSPGDIVRTIPTTTITFNGLDATTQYTFTVVAVNANGSSAASSPSIAINPSNDLVYIDWIKQQHINSTATENNAVCVNDASGNVFIAYSSTGSVSGGSNVGNYDIIIAKYNTYGVLQWLRQYPALNTSSADTWPCHMAIDLSGNIYVTYQSGGSVSGGSYVSWGDIVVAKIDTNGSIQWIQQQPTFNTSSGDRSPSLCVDKLSNVYLSYFNDNVGTVPGGTSGTYLIVAKFNSNGALQWAKQNTFSTGQLTLDPRITADGLSNVYIVFHVSGTVSGGQLLGGSDIVVMKMSTIGDTLWIKQVAPINTGANEVVADIVTDRLSNLGEIYITYTTGGTVSGGTNRGSNDIVVGKLNTSGNVLWLRQYGQMNTTGTDQNSHIVMDSSSNLYLTYLVNGTVSGGLNSGSGDTAIAKLDSAGNLLWVKQQELMNSAGNEVNPWIGIDASGNIYITGQTSGTLSGGTYLGNQDIFLFKMSQHVLSAPPSFTVSVVPGNLQASLTWTSPPTVLVNPITQYVITSNRGTNVTVNGETFSATITNLIGEGASYVFTVTAVNSMGSTPITASAVSIYALPAAPSVSGVGQNTQVTLGWTVPSAGDSPITSYTISWTSASGNGSINVNDPTSTSAVIGSLTNGTLYTFSVYANTLVGVGNTGTANVTPSTTPNNPTVLVYAGRKYSEMLLDITCVTGGAAIINYTVTVSPGGRVVSFPGTARYVSIENLDPSAAYSFSVVARNINGSSGATATGSFFPSAELHYLDWIKQYPALNTTGGDVGAHCGLDASGNVYIVWEGGGTVSGGISRGSVDIVVAKLNPNGDILWTRQQHVMNTTGNDYVPRIAVSPNGAIHIAYQTQGTASGGTNLGSFNNDIVVLKMDTNGNTLWVRQNPILNTAGSDVSPSIGIDSSGNVYVTYQTNGSVSSGLLIGNDDIALIKFNSDGASQWVRQFAALNTTSSDRAPRLVVDSSGNSYIAYFSFGTVSSGIRNANDDIVVTKIDTDANVLWVRQQQSMNTSATDSSPSMGIDPSGNLYVSYNSYGTVSGGTFLGGIDIITFKMDNNGTLQWVKQYRDVNTTASESAPQLTVDASGNSYIAYQTSGAVSGGLLLGTGQNTDIVVHKLDTNGNLMWVKQQDIMNTGLRDERVAIVSDASGSIYVVYSTTGAVSGGISAGGWDIAIFKMSQHTTAVPGSPTNIIVSGGDARATLTWTPPENNNSLLTGYTITSSPGSIVTTVGGSVTTAEITGLINNVRYTFAIYATNSIGDGPTVTTAGVTPTGGLTAPDPPTGLFASADYGLATVTWTPPLNNGGTPITSYKAICTPAADGFRTVIVEGNTLIATFNNLLNGVVYTFTVRATNATGESVASAAVHASYVDPVITAAIQSSLGDSTALDTYIDNAILTKTIQEIYLEFRNSLKNTELSIADQANITNLFIKGLMRVNSNNDTIFTLPNYDTPFLFSSSSSTTQILPPKATQVVLPEYNASGLATYTVTPLVLDGSQYVQFEIPPSYQLTVVNVSGSANLSFNGNTVSDGTNQYVAGDRITIGSHTYIVSAIGSITLLPVSRNKMVMMANNNGILKTQGNLSILAVSVD